MMMAHTRLVATLRVSRRLPSWSALVIGPYARSTAP
jgi:hypothetical protein